MRLDFLKEIWEKDEIQNFWQGKWKAGQRIQLGDPSIVGIRLTTIVNIFNTNEDDLIVFYFDNKRMIINTETPFNEFETRTYRWIPTIYDLWVMRREEIVSDIEMSKLIQLLGFDGKWKGKRGWDKPVIC